ncbi:Hypothetical predicted protein [Podarcis lilfordi]|uniref:Uncharacterized protein n=1 Tax=Podarcis lilfordi TaxID=74358 RepID=A0AA35L9Y3_9SAUR|nr:Hypothetical predicted protein [Podarcis lilfordi]
MFWLLEEGAERYWDLTLALRKDSVSVCFIKCVSSAALLMLHVFPEVKVLLSIDFELFSNAAVTCQQIWLFLLLALQVRLRAKEVLSLPSSSRSHIVQIRVSVDLLLMEKCDRLQESCFSENAISCL